MEESKKFVVESQKALQINSETTLEVLQALIQSYLLQYQTASLSENAMAIGKCLMLIKGKLLHGEFQVWLKKDFKFSLQTARKFMKIYSRFGLISDKARYSVSQMIEMLALTESDTAIFIAEKAKAGTPVEKMRIRQLRDEVKKYTVMYVSCDEVPVEKNSAQKHATNSKHATSATEKVTFESKLLQGLKLITELPPEKALQNLVAKSATEDLQKLEKQLNQLLIVHQKLQGYVEEWKKQQSNPKIEATANMSALTTPIKDATKENAERATMAASYNEKENKKAVSTANAMSEPAESAITSDNADSRAKMIKQLQQIILNDDANFTKSKRLRELVRAQSVKTVHQLDTEALRSILETLSNL